ncbi:MAG: DUF3325 domain-containing protein [Proteobacteria bacterium]|nr:DUF3325 domain-containing protein [Pseudomonadota bacterium]
MVLLGSVLILLAWPLLILSMAKHQEQIIGRLLPARQARALRATGWLALAASLGCLVSGIGWEQGPVFWTAGLMLGGIVSALAAAGLTKHR